LRVLRAGATLRTDHDDWLTVRLLRFVLQGEQPAGRTAVKARRVTAKPNHHNARQDIDELLFAMFIGV